MFYKQKYENSNSEFKISEEDIAFDVPSYLRQVSHNRWFDIHSRCYYTTDELRKIGYTDKQINNFKKISIYDEIMLNPDLDKIE